MEKKILLLSSLPPPFGGVSFLTQLIMKKGIPSPFSIRLLNTSVPPGRILFEHYNRINIREIRRNLRIIFSLIYILIKEPIQLVQINCSISSVGFLRNWICAIIIYCFKLPMVVHLHGNFKIKNRFKKWIFKTIFFISKAILVSNRDSFENVCLLGKFVSKCQIFPNFIDMEGIPPKPVKVQNDGFNLLFIGWIAREKGALTIFEVAKCLPKVKVTLVGEPTKDIRQLFKTHYQTIDNLEMTGRLPKPELIQHLLNADVFIFPSFSEGFPCSVTEAMAYGLPILASPVGAIPDMIENGKGGFLIESQDVDGYVKAVLRLMENKGLCESMGTYNRIKANREYDYAVVMKKLCNLYDSVLDGFSKANKKQ